MFMPVALDHFVCSDVAWPAQVLVHAVRCNADPLRPAFDFTVLDADGNPLAQFQKLVFRRAMTDNTPSDPQRWLYQTQWTHSPPDPSRADAEALRGRWLLLADERGVAQALAKQIEQAGGSYVAARPGQEFRQIDDRLIELDVRSPEHFRRLISVTGKAGLRGIVHCWPIGVPYDLDEAPAANLAKQAFGYGAALHLVQAATEAALPPPLFMVTAAACPTNDAAGAPAYGIVSALRRTVRAECPEIACRTIDLAEVVDPAEAAAALAIELQHLDEPEVALRGELRLVPRLVPASFDMPAAADNELVELKLAPSGLIDELGFVTRQRSEPEPDHVEIEVHAAGLNFRDVMNALGMLPGTPQRTGGECAGVIVRAGSASGFSSGEPVMAFCPGQSGSFVTVPARHVVRKPERLDFAQAAGLPIAYLTTLYGLQRIASLQAGETILIHAAAGGLGSAAMHYALAKGATVYATAGSAAKRQYVRSCGATAVMSSRTLAFADAVLAATNGRGVDVVLNTLSGDFVPASFRALANGGRFIEVGKRGVFTEQQAKEHRPDVQYHKFDLGEEAERDPTLIPALLRELAGMIETAAVPPLKVERLPFAAARTAFRKLAEARHIGKLVLSHRCTPAGTWLITGGFGALGLHTANWLADRGVRTIVLAGPRRRRPEAIAAIEGRGVAVIAAEADCADADALRAIIAALPSGQKLRGVIHCAGTLADATLPQQDWASFEQVARAKYRQCLRSASGDVGARPGGIRSVLVSRRRARFGRTGQLRGCECHAAFNRPGTPCTGTGSHVHRLGAMDRRHGRQGPGARA